MAGRTIRHREGGVGYNDDYRYLEGLAQNAATLAQKALGNRTTATSTAATPAPTTGSGGSVGITSVGLIMPGGFTVSNSPLTANGNLTVKTTVEGIVISDGANFAAATPGTDYVASAAAGTGITRTGSSGAYTFSLTQTTVVGEAPTGAIDGVNTSFTLAHSAVTGSAAVYMGATAGGLLSRVLPASYTVTGTALAFTTAPAIGQSIIVDYRY
jgi:hypothetical protein